jgi:hypothetical protein
MQEASELFLVQRLLVGLVQSLDMPRNAGYPILGSALGDC